MKFLELSKNGKVTLTKIYFHLLKLDLMFQEKNQIPKPKKPPKLNKKVFYVICLQQYLTNIPVLFLSNFY